MICRLVQVHTWKLSWANNFHFVILVFPMHRVWEIISWQECNVFYSRYREWTTLWVNGREKWHVFPFINLRNCWRDGLHHTVRCWVQPFHYHICDVMCNWWKFCIHTNLAHLIQLRWAYKDLIGTAIWMHWLDLSLYRHFSLSADMSCQFFSCCCISSIVWVSTGASVSYQCLALLTH